MKKIIGIIGARPQFIKHAPIEIAFKNKAELISIHTGQHYDHNMSQIFFDELGMKPPKYQLEVGSHSHGVQTGRMLADLEPIIINEQPDAILVYGDTNSTLAGALVGSKLHIPIIHVEAGLRSFNRAMPEEINRVLTDHVSAMLFVPTTSAIDNLAKEGIVDNIYFAGDVMCDMIHIVKNRGLIKRTKDHNQYYFVTLHRPYNTDSQERLTYVLGNLNQLDKKTKFPIHPRTRHKMKNFGMKVSDYPNIEFCEPFSYFENINQLANSSGLITDSGGMQKEAYWLRKKCVTVRTETEWVETLDFGCNTLIFEDLSNLNEIIQQQPLKWHSDLYGNGNAATQIVNTILNVD